MMEQWNDVQEKGGSDAEHRNQDKKESFVINRFFGVVGVPPTPLSFSILFLF